MKDRISSNWGSKAIKLGRKENFRRTGRELPIDPRAEQEDKIKYMESYLSRDKRYIPYEKREAYERHMQAEAQKQREKTDNMKPLLVIIVIIIAIGYILYSTGAFNIG